LVEHVTPKLVPLTLPEIGICTNVTLIESNTHASEVFTTSVEGYACYGKTKPSANSFV
jgi:hypothetical protein